MNNYYFGEPDTGYNAVLDNLTHTEVHSIETSSIPLADFWHPRNLDKINQFLETAGLDIDIEKATKCFEYPVFAEKNKREIGKPSRTDLMIFDDKYNIAIEAKYTEDLYESIKKWTKDIKPGSKKPDVLQSWYDYIEPYSNYNKNDMQKIEHEVVYQFLHRTASACYGCKKSSKIPVVIYQLFYDANDKKSENHQKEVAAKIKDFGFNYLEFNEKIIFRIVLTPLLNVSEVNKSYQNADSDVFLKLKKNNIYSFGDSHLFMEYTKKDVIKIVSDYFLRGDLVNLYKDKCINYKGNTKDTNEPYIKIIAECLSERFCDFEKGFENAVISRTSSYKTKSHIGISDFDFYNPKKGERREEKIAHAMFCQYKNQDSCLGKILDYQIPLKNSKNDKGAGKIDLLSNSEKEGKTYLLELKKDKSDETLLRCILESYTYSKIVDRQKLFKDFSISETNKLIIAPFVYNQDESAKQLELVKSLMNVLGENMKCFTWSHESDGYKFSPLN